MSRREPPDTALLVAARKGDKAAQLRVIALTMWIVKARVRKWVQGDPEDLTQIALAGNTSSSANLGGLMRAIETFDPYKGASFWNHATTWIDKALRENHRDSKRKMRDGVTVSLTDYEAGRECRASMPALSSRVRTELDTAMNEPPRADEIVTAHEQLDRLRALSPSELELAAALVRGETYESIAARMGIDARKVQRLVHAMRRKVRGHE